MHYLSSVVCLVAAAVTATGLQLRAGHHGAPVNVSHVTQVPTALSARGHFSTTAGGAPCQCETSNAKWKTPHNRAPECLFIDLGAADGETYKAFLGQSKKWSFKYDVGPFKHENCYAYLIEANPRFSEPLEAFRADRVYPMPQTASYMCDKEHEDFYLDVSGPGGWGSALNSTHQSVSGKSGQLSKIEVKLFNLNRLLAENALPGDTVVVKMDIEGAEYDILPCLANSPAAALIDTLYLEDHCPGKWWCPTTGQAGNSKEVFNTALKTLREKGVKVPDGYWSPM